MAQEIHRQERPSLFDVFSVEEREIAGIRERVNLLCSRYGLEDAEVLYLVRKSRGYRSVPAEIFSQRLSPLEALVSFLRNNMELRLSEIARMLFRDQRTVWATFNKAAAKQKRLFIPARSKAPIPLEIFSSRKLSVLEGAALYLSKERGMRLVDVSRLLKKDTSTVWTALSRARKKIDAGVGR